MGQYYGPSQQGYPPPGYPPPGYPPPGYPPPGYPPPGYPPPGYPQVYGQRPHRGGAVLALGIIGLVLSFASLLAIAGLVCSIIAVVMGTKDLREMQAGVMSPAGRGMTNAGRICAIVGLCLTGLFIVAMVVGVFALSATSHFW